MNTIYYLQLNKNHDEQQYQLLLNGLATKDIKEIERFRSRQDRSLRLYSRVLLNKILSEKYGFSGQDLCLAKTEFGKPYLLNQPQVFFNISHSKQALAVGFSNKNLGIDIEKITNANLKIARRFFTANELSYINQAADCSLKQPNSNCNSNCNFNADTIINQRFFEIWTKKEAYLKYHGQGLSLGLSSFDVLAAKLPCLWQTFKAGQYLIAACSANSSFNFVQIKPQQLLE